MTSTPGTDRISNLYHVVTSFGSPTGVGYMRPTQVEAAAEAAFLDVVRPFDGPHRVVAPVGAQMALL